MDESKILEIQKALSYLYSHEDRSLFIVMESLKDHHTKEVIKFALSKYIIGERKLYHGH